MSVVDVSVIIVSFNTSGLTLNCLRSIVATKGTYSQEIIVVDNASSDGSPEAINAEFPQVILIRNRDNLGFAKANNIGIKHSKGRYIALINSDVILLQDCIANLLEFMDESNRVGLLGPRILYPDRSYQDSCRYFPTVRRSFMHALSLDKIFPEIRFFAGSSIHSCHDNSIQTVDVLVGCFWMVRREALEEVGLLDEDFFFYGEDIDWCKRFHETGWGVVYNPLAEAIHLDGGSSADSPKRNNVQGLKANFLYWKKHHNCIGRFCFYLALLIYHSTRLLIRIFLFALCRSKRKSIALKIEQHWLSLQWLLGLVS